MMREKYRRFRAWQENPFRYAMNEEETHHCCNCGRDYTGNFCPQCGQKATLGPVNWSSVRENVMEIWGMGTRSMTYTLWQLLLRPGYLIRDYISGRRQVSFPPVKMLLIVAIISSIVTSLMGADLMDAHPGEKSDGIFAFMDWARRNPGWYTLIVYSSMILPTWAIFHHSPRCTAHTLPQGFFIQVFLGTLVLMFGIFAKIFPPILFLFPIYYFLAYYQLFGYGLWGTSWRLMLAAVAMGCIVMIPIFIFIDFSEKVAEDDQQLKLLLIVGFVLTGAVTMSIGYVIGRWTQKRRMRSEN